MTDDEREAARKLGEAEFSTLFPEMIGEASEQDMDKLATWWKLGNLPAVGYMLNEVFIAYCHSVLKSQQIVQSAPYDDEE